jgi:hypothetical protein
MANAANHVFRGLRHGVESLDGGQLQGSLEEPTRKSSSVHQENGPLMRSR